MVAGFGEEEEEAEVSTIRSGKENLMSATKTLGFRLRGRWRTRIGAFGFKW
jgi:hypothetical protein